MMMNNITSFFLGSLLTIAVTITVEGCHAYLRLKTFKKKINQEISKILQSVSFFEKSSILNTDCKNMLQDFYNTYVNICEYSQHLKRNSNVKELKKIFFTLLQEIACETEKDIQEYLYSLSEFSNML